MIDFSWLEKFTALIQIVSAINFAYIFTNFSERVYIKIFSEEDLINKRFQAFLDGPMAKTKETIEHMESKKDNIDLTNHITLLKNEYLEYSKLWDGEKKKIIKIIEDFKKIKGIKSLFLFISVFCIIDLFNIALVNVLNCNYVINYIYLFNFLSLIYVIWIIYKIASSGWNEQKDIYCYNQTRRYITYNVILSIVLPLINELIISHYKVLFDTSISLHYILQSHCVILPLIPCLISIFIILYFIFIIWIRQTYTKLRIRYGLRDINRKKKDIDNAVRQLTTFDWK